MDIGDEITIKAKVVDFDSNPHGSSVKVEVTGFMDNGDIQNLKPFKDPLRLWIHRQDIPNVIIEGK